MRRIAVALAFALALSAAAASPAQSAEKAIWGPVGEVNGHGDAFDLYRRLGVDTYQATLNFGSTAPTRPADPRDPRDPAYLWPRDLDRAVADGARTGIAVAILVTRSPPWANGDRHFIFRPSDKAYADFLIATARRYPSVRRWMIWGEPNREAAFQPNSPNTTVGARSYARLLDAAYGALKSVSRRNIVIGGMTYTGGGGGETTPAPWLKGMKLPNGRPPRLDWYGHNPFSTRYPRIADGVNKGGYRDISDVDTLSREVARTYRRIGRRPKLWLSEYVIQSDHGSKVFNYYVSRRGQAQWLRAAFRIANSLPPVAGLGWVALQDEPESNLSTTWGLITAKGTRKPAFSAYRTAPSRAFRPLVDANRRLSRRALGTRGLRVAVRTRAGGRIRVVLARRNGRALIRRTARVSKAGARKRIALRSRRLPSGRYVLVVDAPRGERVRRSVVVH